jgi:hypothetical protein
VGFRFFETMIRFNALHDLFDKVQKLDDRKAWRLSTDRNTRQFIISMNTNEQLGEEGIDANDSSLGDYAPMTVQFRRSKGLQVGHIDFKVTGQYWRSWRVRVRSNELIIEVDKDRFTELVELLNFSEDHVGLTEENLDRLAEMIKRKYIDYVRRTLQS